MKKIVTMKKYVLIISLLLTTNCFAQLNIVPVPAEVKMGKGIFTINKNTKIIVSGLPVKFVPLLNDFIFNRYGFKLGTIVYSKKNIINTIRFVHDAKQYGAGVGVYALQIKDNGIFIGAGTEQGFFYGLQTFFQLMPVTKNNLSIPQLFITDYPRFPYRGMHLDVARHFFTVSIIKKYIDYLAAYKFNTFHWHLTDDQGWRIEIKKYPLLTQVGGYRNGTIIGNYPGKSNDGIRHGGYYTQQQIKEIVQYAAEKYITVIPEIEMPGHASAAIAAYPQLSCFPDESTKIGNTPWAGSKQGKQVQQTWGVFEDVFAPTDYTFNFLQDVLDEVITLFPSKYIHIGGDECPKEAWKKSPFCQELIKKNNLKDEHGLQSYFINRIEKYVNSKGKNIIGWDEILEGGLAPNATVMSWRGEQGGIEAAQQNHSVIMTPSKPVYFDYSQSKNEDSVTIGGNNSVEAVYAYEPIPAALNATQAKYVLGAQANLWTEYIQYPSKIEYMIFPRMIALSEVLWSPAIKRNWTDFVKRLPSIFERLDKEKINYSKAYYDVLATVIPAGDNIGVLWKLTTLDSFCTTNISKYTKLEKPEYVPVLDSIGQEVGKKLIDYRIDNSWFIEAVDKPVRLQKTGLYIADLVLRDKKNPKKILLQLKNNLSQSFFFNKATGKKITLTNLPDKNYPGDGAFTLVNGVQNEKGMAKPSEFVGFSGTNLEAIIDLGAVTEIKEVRLHTFTQIASRIYPPQQNSIAVLISNNGINFKKPQDEVTTTEPDANGVSEIWFSDTHTKVKTRYIKVIAKNYGIIPVGKPGAGEKAWLFVDEIEVE